MMDFLVRCDKCPNLPVEAQHESAAPPILHCSFCGKSQHEVRKLIAGPRAFIRDECVDLCTDIVEPDYDTELFRPLKGTEKSDVRAEPIMLDLARRASTEERAPPIRVIG